MTQRELDCEVARATGESVATVAGMGFTLLTAGPVERERDREPLLVDWDELNESRTALFPV